MHDDSADGVQGVPRVQPVARGGLGLQRTRTVCTRRRTSRCSIPSSPPRSSSSCSNKGARWCRSGPVPPTAGRPPTRSWDRVLVAAERERRCSRRTTAYGGRHRSTARRSTRCGAQSVTDPVYNATLSAGARLRPRHPRTDRGARARQPVRPLPERPHRQHRARLHVDAVRAAHGRPRGRRCSSAASGVRSDDAGPAVRRVQGAHLHLPVPRGRRRRPHRAHRRRPCALWGPTGRTPRATSCPATSPTASRSCPRPTSRRSCATTRSRSSRSRVSVLGFLHRARLVR